MKILIAAAGRSGTTLACAAQLAQLLPGAAVADLEMVWPDPAAYDAVIVGSAVRMGRFARKAAQFLQLPALKDRPFGCFCCCGLAENAPRYLAQNLPAPLAARAVTGCFGGRLDPLRLRGMDRFIVRSVAQARQKENLPAPQIDTAAIGRFAAAFLAACGKTEKME